VAAFKVVITDFGDPDYQLEADTLAASGLDIELVRLNTRKPEELRPHVADAHGLIVQWANIDRGLMDAMRNCKVISRYGIGVDMVDLDAATEHGILVCNVPDYCIDEVSNHTLAFLLALNRHLRVQHAHVAAGHWGGPPGGAPARLTGQTLGLIGLGNIGRVVAAKAAALGLKVIAFDPYLSPERAASLGVSLRALDTLLSEADYVSVHCPLTAETRHLIGAAQLARMKPSAYLINMARGPIVDQAALVQALRAGQIAGAALDVQELEPPAAGEPLLQLPNVLFTPHTASWSAEAVLQLRRETAQNVVRVLAGQPPRSVVNPKVLAKVP
jgi:D-3-phosphoglycerate dehydrogenase / 2-oxoglutarate reductase